MHDEPRRRPGRLIFGADLSRVEDGQGLWQQERADALAPDVLDALRHALAHALTPLQREAVEAFFFEGLSQGEIAERAGVSQQVIQRRIYGTQRRGHRIGGALSRLRTALLAAREPRP